MRYLEHRRKLTVIISRTSASWTAAFCRRPLSYPWVCLDVKLAGYGIAISKGWVYCNLRTPRIYVVNHLVFCNKAYALSCNLPCFDYNHHHMKFTSMLKLSILTNQCSFYYRYSNRNSTWRMKWDFFSNHRRKNRNYDISHKILFYCNKSKYLNVTYLQILIMQRNDYPL